MATHRRRKQPATLYYVDAKEYEPDEDELAAMAPAVNHAKRLTVISMGTRWTVAAECVSRDQILSTILREIQQGFDVRFAIDAVTLETLTEISPDDTVCDLARSIGRRAASDDFVCYLSETYRKFMLWAFFLGSVPVAYIHRSDIEQDASQLNFCSKSRAVACARHDADKFNTYDGVAKSGNFIAALKKLDRGSNAGFRDIKYKMDAITKQLSNGRQADHVALTALELLKFYKDGHVLYVPDLNANGTVVLYDHASRGYRTIDAHDRVFDVWIDMLPPLLVRDPARDVPDVQFRSAIYDGSAESLVLEEMKLGFLTSAMVNAKRSVVVAPGNELTDTDKKNDRLREFAVEMSEKYPHQIYTELVRTARARDSEQRASVAASLLGTHRIDATHPAGGTRTTYAPGNFDLLENFQEQIRDGVLDEFRHMLASYKTTSECYTNMTEFLDAVRIRAPDAMNKYDKLSPVDKDFVAPLMGNLKVNVAFDRPEIHRVNVDTKLLATFNATAGLSDIEELYHLWGSLWETKFTGTNLYTRRKNAVKYEGAKESLDRPKTTLSSAVMQRFSAAVNAPCRLITEVAMRELSVVDLSIIMDKLSETTGVRSMLAKSIAINPSSFKFRPLPETDGPSTSTSTNTSTSTSKNPSTPHPSQKNNKN